MCGIVGIFDMQGMNEIDRPLLSAMNHSQLHRGPDEGGVYLEPGLGLGHRRLAIIDLATGRQPMSSVDGNVVLTYNGEIYNFVELRAELVSLGFKFSTHSDTEVVIYAWQAWGERCVERFRGMFAFALWDRSCQTLFLARDRLGIKPLYYARLADNTFIFSSELKALKLHPLFPTQIDPTAIEDYFCFGYVPDPKCIYAHVYKLEPGYSLIIQRGLNVWRLRQYWDLSFAPISKFNVDQIAEQLIQNINEAVKICMVADVPIGAFLSGGVDSSAVVALMSSLSDKAINTCSISFGDAKFNESKFADQVAQQYGTFHQVQQIDANDFSLINQLNHMYDEPYADSSAIPTFRVCQLARQNLKVVLSGDGGDENFIGYRRHRWHGYEEQVRAFIPDLIRIPLFSGVGKIYPKMDWAPKIFRAKTTLQSIGRDSLAGYLHGVSITSNEMRELLFSKHLKQELQGYKSIEVFKRYSQQIPDDPLAMAQYLDFKTYLAGDILTKVDRASMANGLEVRVPLLDHKLVEWIATLPTHLKLYQGEGKYIFKKALTSYLPDNILYRPKMGFSVPLSTWFRGSLKQKVNDTLLGEKLIQTGLFNEAYLHHLVTGHQSGLKDYSTPIWALMMFEAFLNL